MRTFVLVAVVLAVSGVVAKAQDAAEGANVFKQCRACHAAAVADQPLRLYLSERKRTDTLQNCRMAYVCVQPHLPHRDRFVRDRIMAARPDALQVIADSGTLDLSDRIAAFALAQRLPSFSTLSNYTDVGGLLAYGPVRRKLVMKSGYYVKRILEGANPGDLPVEQPTQIGLSINLKTAAALGIEIPANLQQLADTLIE